MCNQRFKLVPESFILCSEGSVKPAGFAFHCRSSK